MDFLISFDSVTNIDQVSIRPPDNLPGRGETKGLNHHRESISGSRRAYSTSSILRIG